MMDYSTNLDGCGIKVLLPQCAGSVMTVSGTQFFTANGEEIKGVTKFSIPEIGVGGILEMTITVPVIEISYPNKDEIATKVKKVLQSL